MKGEKNMKKMFPRGLTVILAVVLCMTLFTASGWKRSGVKNQMVANVLETIDSGTARSEIRRITFLNSRNAKGTDVSARKDGSVIAWMNEHRGSGMKDLYIAANGKVIAPNDCSGLFEEYTALEEINFNNCFDTAEVTDMSNMFSYCMQLSELDLTSFNTKNVKDMNSMFLKCMNLKSVDMSGFDTSSVTDMSFMCYHCYDLKEIDVRNFDTKKVKDMTSMFEVCTSLLSLDLSSFYTGKDTAIGFMVWRCNSLEYLDICHFDCSKYVSDGSEAMFTDICCNEIYAGVEIRWPAGLSNEGSRYNTILFGNYEQNGQKSGYTECIEWIVLDVQDDKALLLSAYALDAVPYHKTYATVTWENCTLRSWLNSKFLKTAFTEEEQAIIFTTKVDNSASQGNEKWRTKNNSPTNDKIFLLSYEETNQYFADAQSRICQPTEYAVSRGADIRLLDDGVTEAGWWWLRSPGEKTHHAAFVNFDGERYSNAVANDYLSVRPAMWIDLDAYYTYFA